MPSRLGSRADRLAEVRALQSVKGRREQRRFAFEGATLLAEARASAFPIEEVYATAAAYDATPLIRELDAGGTPTFIVAENRAANISDLKTPSGIVAVAPIRLGGVDALFGCGSPTLVLADLNDPGNAGTLMRSADAFACAGLVFGSRGVDPYHPKVVRGSMGAVFRVALAVADPAVVARAAAATRVRLLGLAADGACLAEERWERPTALIVGHERHGLGRWASICERFLAIRMVGRMESLSAAVAGSIALYEASLKRQ